MTATPRSRLSFAGLVLLALLIAACSHVPFSRPALLPFPTLPQLDWQLCGPTADFLCLNASDADKLDKFFEKYRAYQAAQERLRGK